MKLIFPAFYSTLLGSSVCTAHNLLRTETNEKKHNERRVLQGLPPVVGQEIGIIGTVIPQLDLELSKFETTLAIRFTNYYGAMWWNCVAAYSNTYMDSLTKGRPSVVVTDSNLHSSANRALCAAQSAVTYSALSMPGAVDNSVTALAGIGIAVDDDLDAAVAACSDDACLQALAATQGFDGVTMGHIIAKQVYDFSLTDGWNQLGTDDGCVVNCRPYRDVVSSAAKHRVAISCAFCYIKWLLTPLYCSIMCRLATFLKTRPTEIKTSEPTPTPTPTRIGASYRMAPSPYPRMETRMGATPSDAASAGCLFWRTMGKDTLTIRNT